MRKRLVILGAVLATAIVPAALKGYSTYSKWGINPTFYLNPANQDGLSAAAVETAIQVGLDLWSTGTGSSFRGTYGGRVSDTSTANDGRNVVIFRNTSNGSAIATTYSWWDGTNTLIDSDIVFWDGGKTFFTGTSGCASGAYIEDIAAHEFGHAIGLNHSSLTEATMYASYGTCSQKQRTLDADDIAGALALYPVSANTAPTVTIASPVGGTVTTQGTVLTFSGSANDQQQGNLSASLIWMSSIDGQIGSGASFSRSLSAGTHTITARVTDSGGLSGAKQIGVTVNTSTNTAPTVSITSPANGTSVAQGTALTFTGSASDPEQGNLSASLVWTSNIDGQIGTGATFSRTLTVGSHTITARVTDGGGLQTSRQIGVSVTGKTLSVRKLKIKSASNAELRWTGIASATVDVYRNGTKIMSPANDGLEVDRTSFKSGAGTYSYKACEAGTTSCTNLASVTF